MTHRNRTTKRACQEIVKRPDGAQRAERPLRELLLPRAAANRLCFFSLPLELLPFYRERAVPAVEEVGVVPVTADDVVTPGDTISATIDTLIDRFSVMVAELASS
jgi:hypothetical protein